METINQVKINQDLSLEIIFCAEKNKHSLCFKQSNTNCFVKYQFSIEDINFFYKFLKMIYPTTMAGSETNSNHRFGFANFKLNRSDEDEGDFLISHRDSGCEYCFGISNSGIERLKTYLTQYLNNNILR